MRALLSVYDKTGLVDLARGLHEAGWELVSSGGSAKAISDAGIPVVPLVEWTGFPEMLGHRVVTLHPKVHGGILADRSDPSHLADMETYNIQGIDLVVVNLYPFGSNPGIELIDIGGPAMVRAAAKNHAHVGVVVNPADYDVVLEEIRAGDGTISLATRRRLARDAFALTAAYDAAIVGWLDHLDAATEVAVGNTDTDSDTGSVPHVSASLTKPVLPRTLHLALERTDPPLRYGENPHQVGARYRQLGGPAGWWDRATQHGGIALSYLNIFDADAAWNLVHELGDGPAAAIIKHANPCGAARAATIDEAYAKAFECDPISAFGGIVALNQPVDATLAEELVANPKADVLIAPTFTIEALSLISTKKKNLRIISAPTPDLLSAEWELRKVGGGYLVQHPDRFVSQRTEWKVVTDKVPGEGEWDDIDMAWRVCAYVKSNAIVLVQGGVAWGIGAGQQNRRDSGRLAGEKAKGRAAGGVCASDAFFPFPDGLDGAIAAGASTVIQPGGSMGDQKVIGRANEAGLAMIFTGERHFRH